MISAYFIATVDAIGSLLFFLSAAYALRNFEDTRLVSNSWFVFALGLFLAGIWAGTVSAEWFGVHSAFLDEGQQVIIGASITAFAIGAWLIQDDLLKD